MAEGDERPTQPAFSESTFSEPVFSEVAPVAVGSGIWALLFILGMVLRQELEDNGRGWWIWTAAAGLVLGLVGYLYLRRRQVKQAKPAPLG